METQYMLNPKHDHFVLLPKMVTLPGIHCRLIVINFLVSTLLLMFLFIYYIYAL